VNRAKKNHLAVVFCLKMLGVSDQYLENKTMKNRTEKAFSLAVAPIHRGFSPAPQVFFAVAGENK
jgi:hypothetical protein